MDTNDLLEGIYGEFADIEEVLRKLTKEEARIEDDVLVKHGLLIRTYSIRYQQLTEIHIDDLELEIEHIFEIEKDIGKQLEHHVGMLKMIANDLNSESAKVHFKYLRKYFDEAISATRKALQTCQQLRELVQSNARIHKKKLDQKNADDILLFEKHTNAILRFIDLLKAIVGKTQEIEKKDFFDKWVKYGRAMSKHEYKLTKKHAKLCCNKNPTPVFDCPDATEKRLLAMSKDGRKIFFQAIGIQNATNIIIFQTRRKPINVERSIPQSNGLREYKLPKGTAIEILKAA